MEHDEDGERDLHHEEYNVEDDQHPGGPACPPHSRVGGQQSGLNPLGLSEGI